MKYLKFLILLSVIIILCSCGKQEDGHFGFDVKHTKAVYVESDMVNLLAVEYLIVNETKEIKGPFFTRVIFHNETLADIVQNSEFTMYELLGVDEIIINSKEGYRTGKNFEIIDSNIEELRKLINGSNSIEIQVIDLESKEIVINHWIHEVLHVIE